MIINKKWLEEYCKSAWVLSMTKEQEELILTRFGTEPGNGYVWTEQDIYTQIRNILNDRPPISQVGVGGDRI
jgi:hypothetical protein